MRRRAFAFLTLMTIACWASVQVQAQDDAYPPPPQSQQGPYGEAPGAENAPPASEDTQAGEDTQAEDAQRAVARLSIVQGEVNVKRGDTGELVAAAANAPLATQDRLQTGEGSRAELELDYGNLVRLAPNTDLGMLSLQYHRYQLQLAAGTIIYRVLRNLDAQAEIDTPSIGIRPLRTGEYRISVFDDGTTQIAVRSGELQIEGPRGTERFGGGKTILVRGDASDPEFQTTYEIARDQFDDWSQNRDRQLLASQSYRYVSPDIDGADDLDGYGSWVPSQYGVVWAPRPPVAGWAPYSYGHWVWEPYYGWSWVDYAPWGWAPFHYGRWFWNTGYGWCWWPGSVYGRHFWRPAVVGFFGIGGVGVSVGFGGLGWVALAPFEVFHPWWGHGFYRGYYGRGGYGNLTVIRNTNIVNVYRNTRINGAAIVTNGRSFGTGNARFAHANFNDLRSANLFRGGVPVSPARASFNYGNRSAAANPRFAAAEHRNFFASQRVQGVAHNSFAPARGMMAAPQRETDHGWQRFGAPGTANGFRGGSLAGGTREPSGWHQFGVPQQPNGSAAARAYRAPQPSYRAPAPSYGANGYYGYRGGQPNARYVTPAPRYNAPAAPRYSAPMNRYSAPAPRYSAPMNHYSAPAPAYHGGGGSFHGGEAYHGGGGSYHGGGGSGGHSGGGGHRGR